MNPTRDQYLELRSLLDQDIGDSPFTIETYSEFLIAFDGEGSKLVIRA